MDSGVFEKVNFKDEKELEKVVHSNSETIFGEGAIYIPQQTLQTGAGSETVPDAIVIDLEARRWFIVEVELATHSVWSHIAPQIAKQIVAATRPKTRKELIKKIIDKIEESPKFKAKFNELGIPEMKYFDIIGEILEQDPTVVIPIDKMPADFNDWAQTLKYPICPVVIEKYLDREGRVAYRIDNNKLEKTPPPLPRPSKPPISREEFLRLCEEPGRLLFQRLEELAKEKGDEFKAATSSFSYYAVRETGEKVCLLNLWPTGLVIMRSNFTPEKGISPEASSAFREAIMNISEFTRKYDQMVMPGCNTRQGSLTKNEVEIFVQAFRKLRESMK